MSRYETPAAVAVVGLAGFQLWDAWNKNAPTLAACRAAGPDDTGTAQQLLDASLTVGSLALIIGVTFAVLTRDLTVLLIMMCIMGTLALWHYQVLTADKR